ncbi:MAG TPA: YfhO family protein, partial [Chitinophagaceae bacterium]|nr:YfhO family protein [Chitinophagaceae bacterium]
PALLGSLILLYEKKYWLGGALTALFSALEIGMNHLQISYYFFIIAAFMTVGYLYKWIKEKEFKHMAIALSIALLAGLTGVLSNATNIFVTYDYSKATMRNGTLGLDTASNSGTKKAGLPIDYAFGWSYGISETYTLLVPNAYGGTSSGGTLDGNSKLTKTLEAKGVPEDQAAQFASGMPTYWGDQPFTSGPVYLGAIICFLAFFGMVYLKTWHKWWILSVTLLAILMAWGKNFEGFNAFLFNYLPLYNKFRAPTLTLVIPQFCFSLLAALTLQRLFFGIDSSQEKWKKFKQGLYVTSGFIAIGILLYVSGDYNAADTQVKQIFLQASQNQQDFADEMYRSLKVDRQSLFGGDLLRSFILIALAAALIAAFIKNKIKYAFAIGGLLLLNAFDLIGVGKRYLNDDNFVDNDQYDAAFAPTAADIEIKKDTGYYRVLNLTQDVFNDAITSYHHNSVGGYHPAKLSITEDLLTYQLRKQPMNIKVLNMLNTKYVITGNQQTGQPIAQQNPEALGAAWFVKAIAPKKGPLAVMNGLNDFNPRDTALIDEADLKLVTSQPQMDSSSTINLINNTLEEVNYQSSSSAPGFGVFSEVFYDRGWTATIDGKEAPIIRTNYVLRGLSIPAGQHQIKFSFHPTAYYSGETISLIASLLILIALLATAFQYYRKNKKVVAAKA